MTENGYVYAGSELDIFKEARNWKAYWGAAIQPYLRGDVLEVGAGLGANSDYLMRPPVARLVRLEPDARFVDLLRTQSRARSNIEQSLIVVEDRVGTVRDLDPNERFDTILYLDVLEHIGDDRDEVARASSHLRTGGSLVVLAPAFQFLYSPFDKAIGHYRRYTRAGLLALTPSALSIQMSRYMDAPGALLSAGNRLLLRHSAPTAAQITFWDRWIIPAARIVDPIAGAFFGRSVLCVWRKQN